MKALRGPVVAAAVAAVVGYASSARAELIYGLTNQQQLVTFDSATRAVTSTVGLQGFGIGGELAVGIDVRPATGELYAISSANNIYKIDPVTGARTQVGPTLTTAPAGSYKAIDFNPTVDRIRVVSSGGTNLRVHPDTGAVTVDGTLAFAAGDANAGDTPAVVNAAYTNSLPGVTTTTLYVVEAGNDVLATQLPPNDGTLNTRGPIGFDLATSSGFTGFDISGTTGSAYLAGNNLFGGLAANTLYSVNLGSGTASVLGPVTGVSGSFRDIAVVAVPEPAGVGLLAAGGAALASRRRRRR
jgi:hypothetical protein